MSDVRDINQPTESGPRIGAYTVLYKDLPLPEVLDRLALHGVTAVELGAGNYSADAHCRVDVLLDSGAARKELLRQIESRGMIISALSQHGNPLHPRPEIAEAHHATWQKAVRLAELLEVPVVNAFSGCPGDPAGASHPNWVTCPWPDEYRELLAWQWNERLIPYWRAQAAYAEQHHVRVAIEMHAGFAVYNPDTLLRLKAACGDSIGANVDPSHLYWQGIDPCAAISELGTHEAIFHVHAKDTVLNSNIVRRNGVLDTKPYANATSRSWRFCSVGYGHPLADWIAIVEALKAVGYGYVISIEHEDMLASKDEGLAFAIETLKNALTWRRSPEGAEVTTGESLGTTHG